MDISAQLDTSQIPVVLSSIIVGLVIVCALFLVAGKKEGNLPPIIPIPENEIYSNPRVAYETALQMSGSHVVGVRKKGRLEFIVDDTLIREVLTNDESFSFQDGVMALLNFKDPSNALTDYFDMHDDLVRNALANRMQVVINKVLPVFMRNTERLVYESNRDKVCQDVDALEFMYQTLCEGMTEVILGKVSAAAAVPLQSPADTNEEFVNERNVKAIYRMIHATCRIHGLYQNTSWWGRTFPLGWTIFNWVTELFTSIPIFYGVIGYQIWKKLKICNYHVDEKCRVFDSEQGSVLDYLATKYNARGSKVELRTFLKIAGLISGIFFASIHLTATVAVWVLFQLALRPEDLSELRREFFDICPSLQMVEGLSYEAILDAVRLDSFIREVLRTKGDILSVCRMTRHDVELAGYTIPKGHLIFPLSTLVHLSQKHHGPDASEFRGERWLSTDKRATTIGPTFLSFGLGRWACPGRNVAIAEIKMLIWFIICRATPVLEGNSYEIVDKLEVMARAPRGKLSLIPWKK